MSRFTKSEKEALWATILPALRRAWGTWSELYLGGVEISETWEAQERELFDMNPSLYQGYKSGETPAQKHGRDLQELQDSIRDHRSSWGLQVTLHDLASHLGVQIIPHPKAR